MKLAFILDPLDTLKVTKDSSLAMMREAQQRTHRIFVMRQEDIFWKNNLVCGHAQEIALTTDRAWYRVLAEKVVPLTEFDMVLMRKDPPFDMEYVYSTYLLEFAETQKVKVINSPRAIRDHNEKFSIANFPKFITPTLVSRRIDEIRNFLNEHQDIILKPLDQMGGRSVFRVHNKDLNLKVIFETLMQHNSKTIMAQRYIPEIVNGDKRILLIAGQVVPYALARIPEPGETRANLAAGGRGVAQELSKRDREIAEAVAPLLYQRGLLLVGLDIIGDYLTEINVTSPTCFQEIAQQTGFNVAAMMLDALEKLAN